MAFLASRRGIALIALSVATALINAKGGSGIGFSEGW
jgi:hypothetical protein